MSETAPGAPAENEAAATPDDEAQAPETLDTETPPEGAEALGDPGKKALAAMKAERNEARRLAKEREDELAALRAQAEGREAEHAAELERQRVRDEALAAANARIAKAEVRAAAKGKLADPNDAFRFLDLEDFDVDDEGAVDTAAIEAALDALVESKPYLAAQSGSRFEGSGDGGHRNEAPVSQITEAQLATMTPAEINEARRSGRLDKVLGKN